MSSAACLGVDQGLDGRGPTEVEVGVVLPGEADAAVDLDVELGVVIGGRDGEVAAMAAV